jgi:hypothetical protein
MRSTSAKVINISGGNHPPAEVFIVKDQLVARFFNMRPVYIGNWREDALAKLGMIQRRIDSCRPAMQPHPHTQARFDAPAIAK